MMTLPVEVAVAGDVVRIASLPQGSHATAVHRCGRFGPDSIGPVTVSITRSSGGEHHGIHGARLDAQRDVPQAPGDGREMIAPLEGASGRSPPVEHIQVVRLRRLRENRGRARLEESRAMSHVSLCQHVVTVEFNGSATDDMELVIAGEPTVLFALPLASRQVLIKAEYYRSQRVKTPIIFDHWRGESVQVSPRPRTRAAGGSLKGRVAARSAVVGPIAVSGRCPTSS